MRHLQEAKIPLDIKSNIFNMNIYSYIARINGKAMLVQKHTPKTD